MGVRKIRRRAWGCFRLIRLATEGGRAYSERMSGRLSGNDECRKAKLLGEVRVIGGRWPKCGDGPVEAPQRVAIFSQFPPAHRTRA